MQVVVQSEGSKPIDLSRLIRSSFRSRRKDRCAIFADEDELKDILGHLDVPAERLEERENIHWTGIQRRGSRRWKRTQVGGYFEWFIWYMRWQRFNAFHTVVLLNPVKYMMGADRRGYVDGLLTRLLHANTNRIIIVEGTHYEHRLRRWLSQSGTEASEDASQFSRNELRQLLLSLLCGTRLTRTQLLDRAKRSYWFSVNRDSTLLNEEPMKGRWLYRQDGPFVRLSEDGLRVIQCIDDVPASRDGIPPEMDQQFTVRRRHQAPKLEKDWLKQQVRTVAQELGFFTIPILTTEMNRRLLKMAKEGDFPRLIINQFTYLNDREAEEMLEPRRKFLRRIADELAAEGSLVKRTWYLEVGRPAIMYAVLGRAPMNEKGRCGQCAFYEGVRRHCRLWRLLNQRIGHFPERWDNLTPRTEVSQFEIYKMKNSGKISPHSSACHKFLDKKRDYLRKQTVENCDICGQRLPKQRVATCGNCGTRYVSLARGIRVYTAYEHEFRARYRELTGRDPRTDESEVYSRFSGAGQRLFEKQEYERHRIEREEFDIPAIVLFPGDSVEVRDDHLVVSRAGGKRSIALEGLTVVDYGRLGDKEAALLEERRVELRRVQRYPEVSAQLYRMRPELREALDRFRPQLARRFALAMAQSAINATQRVATIAKLREDLVRRSINEQTWFLQKEESMSSQSGLLTSEAMIMKGYWTCYDTALDRVFAQFGPRKKSRFVREYAADPAGRAKGYTAVDAAINYLHQRRLLKCGLVNAELGLGWVTGDGILHHRSENSRGMGLLLDLADPIKFADREVLLHAFLDYRLNWRDFRLARDRKGTAYYYPSTSAIGTLERLGDEADNSLVECHGAKMALVDAYRSSTAELVEVLRSGDPDSYRAFTFQR